MITSFNITDDEGNPLDQSVSQWDRFRINGTFDLPNNTVSAGDTTRITLPSQITFGDTQAFDLKDESGNVVAHAVIDPDSKTIVLTYTDYVENHSNVKGNFFFYARVDTKVIKENQTIPVSLTIENEVVIPAGNIEYEIDAPTGDDVSNGLEGSSIFPITGNTALANTKLATAARLAVFAIELPPFSYTLTVYSRQ